MKKYILATLASIMLLSSGCATFKDPVALKSAIEKNQKAINFGVSEARRMILRASISDPDKRAEVNAQIDTVAINLYGLIASGDWSPDAITNALKVKEEYANSILSGVGILINTAIAHFEGDDAGQVAILLLKTAADALSPDPQPQVDALNSTEFYPEGDESPLK